MNETGRHVPPNFKIYYKAPILKTVWYWQKARHSDHWPRYKSLQINPYTQGPFIFNKEAKAI